MGPFLLGFMIAALVGITLVYNCYSKREMTEKELRQNTSSLEHNLGVLRKEFEIRIEQREADLKRAKEENKKSISTIELLQQKLTGTKEELEECKQRLEEGRFFDFDFFVSHYANLIKKRSKHEENINFFHRSRIVFNPYL